MMVLASLIWRLLAKVFNRCEISRDFINDMLSKYLIVALVAFSFCRMRDLIEIECGIK